jgi:hypothetical protein
MHGCIYAKKFSAVIVGAAIMLVAPVACYAQTGTVHLSVLKAGFIPRGSSERIVANVCSSRRDVLANPFRQEIGSIGHGFSLNYRAIDLALRLSQVRLGTDKSDRDARSPAQNASSKN